MQIINRTPHDLTLTSASGEIIIIARDTRIFRVSQTTVAGGELNGIPVHVSSFGDVTECDNDKAGGNPSPLPEPQHNVFYIVSGLLASACPNRADFLTPFIVERDATGKPTAWQLGTTHIAWDAPVTEPQTPSVTGQLSIEEYLERAELAHVSPIGKGDPYMGWGALDLPIEHYSKDELIQVAKAWMKQFHETDRHLGMWQSGQYSL